jgi:hypothetical protein
VAEVFKINDIEYEFECKLTNSDGQEVKFTKSAVRGMTISEKIFAPFVTGTISIANPYDFIENEYLLRGDGRDEMYIMFQPKGKSDQKFEHIFVVTGDTNSVNPMVRSENMKTFTLHDKNTIPFSDTIPYGWTCSGKVGDILKDIFKEVLGDEAVDEENWESGDFEMSYMPPLSFRYIDLIHYMMQHFYAKDGDLHVKGFISFDQESEKFQLKLISKLFEENKDNVMEAFSLGDLTDKISTSNPNNPPPDAETGEYIGGLKNIGYSTPLYGWNNDFFVNNLVYGYDPVLGEHKIRRLLIDDLQDKWEKKFVDVFKSSGGKPKAFVVKNKTTKKKFKHFRTPYAVEDGVKMVEAEMYNTLTFYNLQCTFSNFGDTRRKSAKFIDIFKTKDEIIKSDEKLLGRWLVTEVRHIFFADIYKNDLLCCKTYVGPQSNISNDSE